MKEKVRVFWWKMSTFVSSKFRFLAFLKNHKKILLRGGIGAVAAVAIFVTIAALIPAYKYKDVVTVGDLSFTNAEVVGYEGEIDRYYDNGGLGEITDGPGDMRDHYEIAFDDNFKALALKLKANECGIELDDSENSEALDYDTYDFTLIRERNDQWEKKLEKCAIKARNFVLVEAAFDLPQLDRLPQAEADVFYDGAIKRLDQIKPMLVDRASPEELATAAEESNATNGKELYFTDPNKGLALYSDTMWCAVAEPCFNGDASMAHDETIAKPNNIVNMNQVFNDGLSEPGDYIGVVAGDNGWFAIFRLESISGEYDTWNDYYQEMKDQYAYDTALTALFGTVKTLASPILKLFEDDYAHALNAVTPSFNARFASGTDANLVLYGQTWISAESMDQGFSTLHLGQTGPHGPGVGGGFLNCSGMIKFTDFNFYTAAASGFKLLSWAYRSPTESLFGGSCCGNTFVGSATSFYEMFWTGNIADLTNTNNYLFGKYIGWGGGPGYANGIWHIMSFDMIVEEPEKPQPVEDSTPQGSKRLSGTSSSYKDEIFAPYATDLKDELHIKEAIFNPGGPNHGDPATSFKWETNTSGYFNEAKFTVKAYGPCEQLAGGECPLDSNFSDSTFTNKYFSTVISHSSSGWVNSRDKALIIGDSIVGDVTWMSGVSSGNVINLGASATVTSVTNWFNNTANATTFSDKLYIIVYIGANDISDTTKSLADIGDSIYKDNTPASPTGMIPAIKNRLIAVGNPNAKIVLVTPFNTRTWNTTGTATLGFEDLVKNNTGTNRMGVFYQKYTETPGVYAVRWFDPLRDYDTVNPTTGAKSGNWTLNINNCTLPSPLPPNYNGWPEDGTTCRIAVNTSLIAGVGTPTEYRGLTAGGRTKFVEFIDERMSSIDPESTTTNSESSGYGRKGYGQVPSTPLTPPPTWTDPTQPPLFLAQCGDTPVVSQGNKTSPPGSTDWKVLATIANSAHCPAGTYQFLIYNEKNGTNGNNWQPLQYWFAPFGGTLSQTSLNIEKIVKTFQPVTESDTGSPFVDEKVPLSDKITVKEKTLTDPLNNIWPKDSSGQFRTVNVCVEVYGPFNTPQPQVPAEEGNSTKPAIPSATTFFKDRICKYIAPNTTGHIYTFNTLGGGSSDSTEWAAGYYYFYEYIDRDDQNPMMHALIEDNYFPAFNPTNTADTPGKEWAFKKFQPFVTSSTTVKDGGDEFGDGQWLESNEVARDTITSHATDVYENAVNGYQPSEDNAIWPQLAGGAGLPVQVCVRMYGPYQSPQERAEPNGTPTGTASPAIPNNNNGSKNPVKTVCTGTAYNSTTNEGVVSVSPSPLAPNNAHFTNKDQVKTFNFGKIEHPGYYYFVSSIEINSSLQINDLNNYIHNDWYAHFNPKGADYDGPEWTWRKFQPFITSVVYNEMKLQQSDPWFDVKESTGTSGHDEDIIDNVIARAAKDVGESKNGYQPVTDLDFYWPRYSTVGSVQGDYLPVLFKFYICGPFQYPQDNGKSNDMKNPTSPNALNTYQKAWGEGTNICNGGKALKTIAKYITPDQCSKEAVNWKPGLAGGVLPGAWSGPDEDAGMGNYAGGACEINFGRTYRVGIGDSAVTHFYQPGYYYFTSEMVKSDQTTYASTNDPNNPGLLATTPIENFILEDWQSRFNPKWGANEALAEIEWAYVQFQPVARSYANGNLSKYFLSPGTLISQPKGLQVLCREHKNMVNYAIMQKMGLEEFWKMIPRQPLTCDNVFDRVYIGATTTKDVDYESPYVVRDDNQDQKHWPQTNHVTTAVDAPSTLNGDSYEAINYRVKLYGPFNNATAMVNADSVTQNTGTYTTPSPTLKPDPNGDNEAGRTITIVPEAVYNMINKTGSDAWKNQPVAQSCVLSAKYGPNYTDFDIIANASNPTQQAAAYNAQKEKKSITDQGYYKAVFTQDYDNDCNNNKGNSNNNANPGSELNPVTIHLRPGVYVSVVEIWKSDMNENNKYEASIDTSNEDNYFNDNSQLNSSSIKLQLPTESDADKYPKPGEVRDNMANDFHSKWGDWYESIFVPPDINIWTRRDGGSKDTVNPGDRYSDQYWMNGWNDWCTTYKDIFGNCIQDHAGPTDMTGYPGELNYFGPDNKWNTEASLVTVTIHGPFGDARPDTEAACHKDNIVAHRTVPSKDTTRDGEFLETFNIPFGLAKGWYVFVFSYDGDGRVPAFRTSCADLNEQFYLGEPEKPQLETQIQVGNRGKVPAVISDTVKVTGFVENNSIVRLALFRMTGEYHSPFVNDKMICAVEFKIRDSIDSRTYNLLAGGYIDEDGYVGEDYFPTEDYYLDADPNRCFADKAGYYYWHEEFLDPDGNNIQDPRDDGPNEWADIPEEKPEVTTIADIAVMVGQPFHDTAYVKLPAGNEKKFNLYMRAYVATAGVPVCDVVLHQFGPYEVAKSGTYPSTSTTSPTTGYVYWIESLEDEEGNVVAEGQCGKAGEITRIYGPNERPPDEWTWGAPGAPSAGDIILSAASTVGLFCLAGVGAWQLSDKNSWLLSRWRR